MGIEDKQKASKPQEGGKPRWRYHWGNHVPEGLEEGKTQVMFRDGEVMLLLETHDVLFLTSTKIGPDKNDIVAYRIK